MGFAKGSTHPTISEKGKVSPRLIDVIAAVKFPIQLSNSERMCVRDLAARCARALRRLPPSITRGRREDRVRAAPAVPCALLLGKKCTRAYRFSGGNPAFPAQWFTAYSEL